ncbi:Cof-type HAD-IIB family hydrolase [Clostridium sp. NSJ-6]|uniref:Cof-type HAD-IIB family hydrolase n=1 Tax=Clostridium hominis TaxID=2763036 RepID=A0ABR7DCM0_9CLOT|nr:Cof-type HAD-IIB family hydrolase [Clostridium hominis]MBC5629146.1 Cof-type HAD-IIB family hydrolase [Clostridium hominis]MDU2671794.1 Cof-type HAD-IIB family hydrolase [Clostridium sp.]
MIKLIASDMDGTLLNTNHTISEGNIEAIRKAQELGVKFAIITGRSYDGVKPIADEFNLDCEYILMNGAEYRDKDGNILENIAIDKEKVKVIMEVMGEEDLCIELFTNVGTLTSDYEKVKASIEDRVRSLNPESTDDEVQGFLNEFIGRRKITIFNGISELMDDKIDIYKIITFNKDVELIKKVKERLKKVPGLSVVSTFDNDIEVSDIRAQKGLILAKVAEKMGLERDEVMPIGDSFNDYSMFTEFKTACAMGNAIPEIKELAEFVTDTNDNDGVAKAIYRALNI